MREKLETLPVKELREIAKQLEIKSVMKLKKTELIEEIIMVSSATGPELTKDKMEGKKDSMENNAKRRLEQRRV